MFGDVDIDDAVGVLSGPCDIVLDNVGLTMVKLRLDFRPRGISTYHPAVVRLQFVCDWVMYAHHLRSVGVSKQFSTR
jgi:hypothetical protein